MSCGAGAGGGPGVSRTGLARMLGLLLVSGLDLAGLFAQHIRILPASLSNLGEQVVGVGCLWLLVSGLPVLGLYRAGAARRMQQRLASTFGAMLYLMLFCSAMAVLGYVTVGLQAPLIDARLALADRALGFDWSGCFHWIQGHGRVASVLIMAYQSVKYQTIFVLFFCGLFAPPGRVNEFLNLMTIGCCSAVAVAALFPAQGAFYYYGQTHAATSAWVSDFSLLRAGNLPVINLSQLQGLVSMPSFHTCMAIFFTYALRGSRILWPFLLLNTVMILSTPYCGGHYLVDVLAGGLLSAVLIACLRRAENRQSFARSCAVEPMMTSGSA